MPALGAGMDAGRLIAWHVAVGDEVHRGQLVALVETDKATIDVEVFEDGVVDALLVAEGAKVPVGTALATIAAPDAAQDTATPRARTRSSPYARRLARERGLELDRSAGTGPDGVVVARDVPSSAEAAPSSEASPEPAAQEARSTEPSTAAETLPAAEATTSAAERGLAMRQAIARAMERANREIPHYHLGETVDVEPALAWLAAYNADRPPAERLLSAVLVLKAVARSLRDFPDLNGYWIDGGFQPGEGIHLGVAINLRRGGLLAPAIRDADDRSLDELMSQLRDLVTRTRAGGLRGSELTDPTITVSNLGDTGVDTIHGVITPPQVALVGAGRITPRPWAVDGDVEVRRTIALSLAGDHRASDGHRGARFLAAIATDLSRPETL